MHSRTSYRLSCLSIVAAWCALMGCGGHGEGTGSAKQPVSCDPTLVCGAALTCVDGKEYPTTCGPDNCDAPIGPCDAPDAAPPSEAGAPSTDAGPTCDPTLVCGAALTCVDGKQYPTTCGPDNCDSPIGPC